MDFKSYQAIRAINASLLKSSESIYSAWLALNQPIEETKPMIFGRAVHTYLLEPHLFESQFAFGEKFDRRTKDGKAAAEAFALANQGKAILDSEDFEKLKKIGVNAQNHPIVAAMLSDFEKEKSYQWESSGLKYKARLDLVNESRNIIADVKTTSTKSTRDFLSDSINRNYPVQFLHYAKPLLEMHGIVPDIFAIAIETDSCEIAVYKLNAVVYHDAINSKYNQCLENLLKAMELNECPTKYSQEIISLELPNWVK